MDTQIRGVGGVVKAFQSIASGVEMTRTWVYQLLSEWWFAVRVVQSNPTEPLSTRTPPSSGVDRTVEIGSLIP